MLLLSWETLLNDIKILSCLYFTQVAVTHDLLKKMQYLDMCFSEVLRLNAPAGRFVFKAESWLYF